jgi:ADP-ribose pyrophosphatase
MPPDNRFHGRVVTAVAEPVTLPDGSRVTFDVVRHPGGAAVVAVDGEGRVCLLRHYRHVVRDWLWEVPAGKLDGDEPPRAAAERELAEETGLAAGGWESLGAMVSSPGVFTERVHLFLATELVHGVAAPEHGELYELHWVALDQAVRKARDGAIEDAKTVIALWRAAARLGISVVG